MPKVTCHDIEGKLYEVEADKLIYRPSVYGILIENGKVLLSKQWDGYDLPGGGAEKFETLQQTVVREFFEETGFEVEAQEIIHCQTSCFCPAHSPKHQNEYWNCPMVCFLVKKIGGEMSIANFDDEEKKYGDMPEWIDVNDIENIKFINSINSVEVIKKALKLLK